MELVYFLMSPEYATQLFFSVFIKYLNLIRISILAYIIKSTISIYFSINKLYYLHNN